MASWDKTRMREEKAAMLECAGWADADIAIAVNLTLPGLAQLKMRPSYHETISRVKTGVIGDLNDLLDKDIKELRERVQLQIPIALQTIFDAMQQRKDFKLAKDAALDLLAIDGRFAKVSRTGVALQEQGGVGFEDDDQIVKAILEQQEKKRIKDLPVTIDSEAASPLEQ